MIATVSPEKKMEQFSENWTLAAIKQAASLSSGTGIFLNYFSIHSLVSTYTKESIITKAEVFNRCVVILCTIVEVRPYTAIIKK